MLATLLNSLDGIEAKRHAIIGTWHELSTPAAEKSRKDFRFAHLRRIPYGKTHSELLLWHLPVAP